jgi:DNA primase
MDEVAEIKSRLEIAEVVGGYLPLKQAGRNLKAPCPFHQEKSASFMVSPERGIYHCFGCNEGGDIFSFVMKMEGLEFREALEKLARQAGIELQARRGESAELNRRRARLLEAHELAANYFQASLVKNPRALEYIVKQRHLGQNIVRDFRIGYAPDSWNALTDYLSKKGFTASELLEGGLARQKEGSSSIYDLFRGRIMFTIADRDGRPIGFTGRVMDDELPKYMNTPQTALYDKSNAIFGLHIAREAIRSNDEVVIVEGNMDVIASHQVGIRQVVASSGTALTLDQLRTLSKLTKNIKLAFDADRAGLAATERAIELGQKLGLTLRMIETPGAKDPDELIQADPAAWEKAIVEAKYIIDYLFDRFAQDYDLDTAIGKRQYTDRLAANLRRLGDAVERDHYTKLLAKRIDIDEDAVRSKIDNPDAANESSQAHDDLAPRAVIQASGRASARVQLEEGILAMVLSFPLTRIALEDLKTGDFSNAPRQIIYGALRKVKDIPGPEIAKTLTEQTDYINILLLQGEQEFSDIAPADRSFEAFGLARRLQMASNKDLKQVLTSQLREAHERGDAQFELSLLTQLQELNEEEN